MQLTVPEGESFDGALNYTGISRPPDVDALFPVGRRFTPAMFRARAPQREEMREEYLYLRTKPGQPRGGLALPPLAVSDEAPSARQASVT